MTVGRQRLDQEVIGRLPVVSGGDRAAQGAALSRAAAPVTSGAGLGVVTLGGQRLADQAEPDSTTWQ